LSISRARKLTFAVTDDCVGCGACRKKCPWEAISGEKKQKHLIDPTLCQECGTCWYTCPKCAVEDPEGYRRKKQGKPKVPKASIDAGACAGCENCLMNCEHEAIVFRRGILAGNCEVDKSKCKGCGSCLSQCVSGCIELG
jgi:MinD superfamily P-loop ATPase